MFLSCSRQVAKPRPKGPGNLGPASSVALLPGSHVGPDKKAKSERPTHQGALWRGAGRWLSLTQSYRRSESLVNGLAAGNADGDSDRLSLCGFCVPGVQH